MTRSEVTMWKRDLRGLSREDLLRFAVIIQAVKRDRQKKKTVTAERTEKRGRKRGTTYIINEPHQVFN